ncbi:MAG TPA: tripartite tricarboxylate transporter substrate binding protein [Xanthobacteraceae bacterium]|nr:tripartite tricarboxylate transporter substrate binding protein [Xanthobacteraceae bacterium]
MALRYIAPTRILGAIATFLALAVSVAAAQAPADVPSRPVKLVVPFAAGGPTDVVARILADLLSARWNGQSVVIENRPGAGTIVATAAVAKAPPDGTTMLVATNSLLINPAIGQKLPYDTEKDFAAVSMVATQPVALVANKAFPADTIPELVAYAKKRAEPLNFTSPGPRGVGHLAGEMLKQRAGIDMTHINYNGSAPALTDLIAGRVPLMFDIWHSAKRYVDSGELKLIAGAGTQRLADAPAVATIAESYPRFDVIAFNALVAPAGVPAPVLDKLSGDIRAVINSKEFADKVQHLGIFPQGNTPRELDAWMREQIARWAEIAKAANIKAD